MAYIQQFFEQYLPQYFLSTFKKHHNQKDFFDFNNPYNLYSMTLDLLNLAHHQHTNYFIRQWLSSLITKQLLIGYDELRHYRIPLMDSDKELVRFLKSSLQYVHNVLLQMLIRLIAIFLECFESQYLNNTTLTLIQDLSNIYPALKTQISINCPEINLNAFLEKFITLTIASCNSQAVLLALEKIKHSCHFMGATEKLIDNVINQKRCQIDNLHKKIYYSSNQSEEDSDRITKKTKQNSKTFNEVQLFRRKKSKTLAKSNAITLRPTKSMMTIEVTPLKPGTLNQRLTPRSQKTKGKMLQLRNKDASKSPLKKTPLFKKIRKQKKPLERTIYFGQTKKFVPKKYSASQDSFELKQIFITGSLPQNTNLYENSRRTEKKMLQQRQEVNAPLFWVPQTPKAPSRYSKQDKKIVPTNLFRVK